jgi:hypothetical protein
MVDYQTNDSLIITWLTSSVISAQDSLLLKNIISNVQIFECADSFADFITNLTNQQKVIWIVSNSIAINTVSLLNDLPQIHSIYIHKMNQDNYNELFYKYDKVIGVFIDIESIRNEIEKNLLKIERESVSISMFYQNSFDSLSEENNSKKLDSSFMFTQLLKNIILRTKFEQKEKKQLFDYLRTRCADNIVTLDIINQFEYTYTQHSPAWWLVYNLQMFFSEKKNKFYILGILVIHFYIDYSIMLYVYKKLKLFGILDFSLKIYMNNFNSYMIIHLQIEEQKSFIVDKCKSIKLIFQY